ncbi:NAD(P)H-dependent oxidoreductase [Fluviicola sp.]|uniref:NAD(P)H-dependent oxidoreductase n=1 Tax=Fluviicola sp. TaxID=1917219 RepID=UPI0031CFEEC8
MNFTTLANSRYTTKKYDATKKIPEDRIQQLKEILWLSPSSINSQPWKFTFVSDEALKAELAAVSYFNEQKIKDASHLVVFSSIDDVAQFENQIQTHLPEGSVTYYNTFLKPLPEAEIKAWLQHQVYLSLGFFLGACASMDIDSSPMEGIQADAYARILKLDGYKPLFAVALGYRNPEDANQPSVKAKSRLEMDMVVDGL